jgi:all-trans-8'-apo-beta-carotenal 15,15'-oxygenase
MRMAQTTQRASAFDSMEPHMVHKGGFATLDRELRFEVPKSAITGKLPPSLRGTLHRIGPGRNERGGQKFGHWFDGDGMVHAFSLRDGGVHYQNRYVRTRKWKREEAAGRITERSFGQNRPGGALANAGRMPANCANTGIVYHGGKLLALWEGGRPYRLDPLTLDTIGPHSYEGKLGKLNAFSAHGKIDPRTGRYYNFGVRATLRGFALDLYAIGPSGFLVQKGAFDVGWHPFVHDFALTEEHMVFFISPLVMDDFARFVLGLTTFDRSLCFDPSSPVQVIVVRRSDFHVVARIETDPFLVVHYGNAFEEDGELVVDLVRFDDFDVNEALRDVFESRSQAGGSLYRYRIDTARGAVTAARVGEIPLEFPQFDHRFTGAPSRLVFGAALLDNETPGFFNGLARYDCATGECQTRDLGPGRFTSEAIFVPSAPDAAEGEGYLLSVVYDAARNASELLVVSAQRLDDDVACVRLEHHVPYGFHGAFTEHVFV